MPKNLTQILLASIIGLSAGLTGCIEYYGSYAPIPQQPIKQPIRQPIPPPQQQAEEELIKMINQPRILFRDNDPRFSSLEPHYFFVCSYSDRYGRGDARGINYDDERYIYHRGEKCIVIAAVPRNLWGSTLNMVATAPKGEVIARKNQLISEEEDSSNCVFDVSYFLNTKGRGIYKVEWGFDNKIACIQYLRFEE